MPLPDLATHNVFFLKFKVNHFFENSITKSKMLLNILILTSIKYYFFLELYNTYTNYAYYCGDSTLK